MKKVFILLCKLSVASVILYFLLQKIEFAKILRVILSANIFYVFLVFVLGILLRYLTACQTKILLIHQKIFLPTFRVFTINLISGFYTLFLPGDLSGSLVKWYKFSQPEGRRVQALSVVFIAKWINTLSVIGVGLLALMLNNPFNISRLLIFSILAILILLSLPIFNKFASLLLEKYIIDSLIKISPELIKEKLVKMWSTLKKFQELSKQNLISILLVAVIIQLIGIIAHFSLALAVDIKLSIIVFAWLRSVTVLVQMLPISISGLGVREGALFFLLGKYGVAGADALAYSLLTFGVVVAISLIGGILELREVLR